jgi:hypothetical protein
MSSTTGMIDYGAHQIMSRAKIGMELDTIIQEFLTALTKHNDSYGLSGPSIHGALVSKMGKTVYSLKQDIANFIATPEQDAAVHSSPFTRPHL